MRNLTLLISLIFLTPLVAFLAGITQLASASQNIAPGSMVTLTGGISGQVTRLSLQDQSGAADAPSKYVTFTTPGTIYKGYRRFTLPANIAINSVTALKVKINYKGLRKVSQRWSWSLYDWSAKKWVYVGDNAAAKNNIWLAATFSTSLPKRFVSPSREIRLLVQSSNATGNAKLDFESLNITYAASPTPTASPTSILTRTPTATLVAGASSSVYGDALVNGWENWSWDLTPDWDSTSPVHGGANAIAVTYTIKWDGLQFGRSDAFDISGYDTLRFWVHGGASGGQIVQVSITDGTTTLTQDITPQAGTWTMVDMPLTGLSQATQIAWQNFTDHAQSTFYIDDVSFVGSGGPTLTPTRTLGASPTRTSSGPTPTRTLTPPPSSGPALSVDVGADRHTISSYIYGMNFADETLAAQLDLPVRRWGGNSTTRYNWQTNMQNLASDWYFENVPADVSADDFVAQNNRTHTETLMTIPLIGWTPKLGATTHPYDCGFKITAYGSQKSFDQYDKNCGNGVHTNDTNIINNDPADTSDPIVPSDVAAWVNHLTHTYGTAAAGGVQFYNLDNEPGLWSETQRDVHPDALTYDEIRDRTYAYAAAIKAADSTALTLGPVEDGWCRYFFSAADDCNPHGADRTAHGNVDYVAWYLAQMRLYEQQHSVRILDYFDLHVYPQGDGVFSNLLGDSTVQAMRLSSTSQLWDPTYVDESWIGGAGWENGIVRLIPRMHDWVNANYPGTKLAISEYSWGAMGYLNGALAQADVLGIFGREGLDLATLWDPPTASQPGAYAFRIYRNYDGHHDGFGDIGVHAVSTDQSKLAVYAAQRSSDSKLTLIVINKTGDALSSTLSLAGFTPSGNAAQVYRYSNADLTAIQPLADQVVSPGGFSASYPANSITLLVIPGSAP